MKKFFFYLILLIIIILIVYNLNKNKENFTINDMTQVYLDSSGNLSNGNYIIKLRNADTYLSYTSESSNYITNLIIPGKTQKLSSLFNFNGKLISTTSLTDPRIIFKVYNNKISIGSGMSEILVWSRYGLIPNNENCPLLTLATNYTPPDGYFNFLQINNDYTLGNSYLKLDKNGKITTIKSRYGYFDFYKPSTPIIIKPTNYSNYIDLKQTITPGIYFIKFENENAFLGYDYSIQSTTPFVSPKLNNDVSGSGGIIKTTDISYNNIFYIDSNRIIYTYDLYSENKNYFTIAVSNSELKTVSMVMTNKNISTDLFSPLYINFDKTIIINPFDDQEDNIKRYGGVIYPAGINNSGLTEISEITASEEAGCIRFPNRLYAKFNLYPVTFNQPINITDLTITMPALKTFVIKKYPYVQSPPPYTSYSFNDLNSTNLVNPLTSNTSPANITNLITGLYYINFVNTNGFLSYANSNGDLILQKINNFTDSQNTLFYIDVSENMIYSTENKLPNLYFVLLLDKFVGIDPTFRLPNNRLKINKNPFSSTLCQLINTDYTNIPYSFDVNGNETSNQANFTNFKLFPYIQNTIINNIIMDPGNITNGLYYIKFMSEPNTFLSYDPTGTGYFSCNYSPYSSGILTKTTNVYDTSYNLFYIQSDGSIFIPDASGNPSYPINGINTNIDNTIIILHADFSATGTIKIDKFGIIGGGNKIITPDVKLNFQNYTTNNAATFQILKSLPKL